MRILSFLLPAFLIPLQGLAQDGAMFQRTIGGVGTEEMTALITTADGGYALLGMTTSNSAGGYDLYVVRLDANGDTLWTRTVGGSGNDKSMDLVQTGEGDFVLLGWTNGFGGQTDDLLLVKMDAAGTVLWAKRVDVPTDEQEYVGVLHALPGGDLLVGATTQFGAGLLDACVMRLSGEGEVVWATSYGQPDYDECRGLVPTADGGFMLAGRTTSYNGGAYNTMMLKGTESGEVSWVRVYGDSFFDTPIDLEAVPNGYMVAGSTTTFGAGSYDSFLMNVSPAGSVIWAKTYGNAWAEYATDVQATADGGCVLLGRLSTQSLLDQLFLIRTDAQGDTLWTRNYGGDAEEDLGAVVQTADGGYLVCAKERSFGGNDYDAYLVKTDALGYSSCHETDTVIEVQVAPYTAAVVSVLTLPMIVTMVDVSPVVGSGSDLELLCESSTGLHAPVAEVGLRLFPVPCTSTVQLEGSAGGGTITILDLAGKPVSSHRATAGSTQLDMNELPSGSYLLRYTQPGRTAVLRLVKQ